MAVVAVIGASADRTEFGNKALRAFREHGDTVMPINPPRVGGRGRARVRERARLSGTDRRSHASTCRRTIGVRVMDEIAKKGIKIVWLNPGADGDEVIARAKRFGLTTRVACSIIAIGDSPSRDPDCGFSPADPCAYITDAGHAGGAVVPREIERLIRESGAEVAVVFRPIDAPPGSRRPSTNRRGFTRPRR